MKLEWQKTDAGRGETLAAEMCCLMEAREAVRMTHGSVIHISKCGRHTEAITLQIRENVHDNAHEMFENAMITYCDQFKKTAERFGFSVVNS